MNFTLVDDRTLLDTAKDLARQEREVLIAILHHLQEIQQRRLYCDLKYSSMQAYALAELKYSEAQANRRFSAMNLLADLPEVECKVEAGSAVESTPPSAAKSPSAPRVNSKAEIYRLVHRRDQGRCTNCGAADDIQYDHIIPKAVGGPDTLENLRLLCRSCNLRQAIRFYGRRKMEPHLREMVTPYRVQ